MCQLIQNFSVADPLCAPFLVMLGSTPQSTSYSLTASFFWEGVIGEGRAEAKMQSHVCPVLSPVPPLTMTAHPITPAPHNSTHLLELTFPSCCGTSPAYLSRILAPASPPQRAGFFLDSTDILKHPLSKHARQSCRTSPLGFQVPTTPICFLGCYYSDSIIHSALLMCQR